MADRRVVAELDCSQLHDALPGFAPAGNGLLRNSSSTQLHDLQFWEKTINLKIREREIVSVGRDPASNNLIIDNPYVSRNHFQIYSVIYDEDTQYGYGELPMVYVQDCQSLEGTFVNERRIGSKAQGHTPGYLLNHGDKIEIRPYWKFHVNLWNMPVTRRAWPKIQINETHIFRDRYIIFDRRLGNGSVGTVHLALKVRSNRQVACKIHDLDKLRSLKGQQQTVRRVNDESDILAKLHHPNILRFEYAYRSRHTLYTFIELATGGDLFSTVLFHEDSFPATLAQLIVYQIVRAIRHLHRQNLTHRDLKPENIFFADGPSGQGRVIMGDLGFATGTD
ncbi:kinase-like domain-containing protein [Microdochium trichocladiopsis]|uniref:Kinase-like domain-containing protein n=1 Tax=Microdochium trichocladiopsis TaxID=1682393 RepID=A0A9P8YJE0_9PEZI|nr:kinase-like domain-containing protein [Microdochium trichocladiopsis]KAH7041047.1 kinase-like domain-containing protein [Microdochium trichocladiopsis]